MEDVVFNPPINETEICDSIAKMLSIIHQLQKSGEICKVQRILDRSPLWFTVMHLGKYLDGGSQLGCTVNLIGVQYRLRKEQTLL